MKVQTHLRVGQGLGDQVADFTQATGLDRLAKAYTKTTGKDCGCSARQQALNELVPDVSSLRGHGE